MQMPGRVFSSASYRYGFNGKENDNDVKGTGNQQDYGMRIYDPRLGKFLSVDPLYRRFPFYSPYHFAGNSPILNIDLDGAEPYNPNQGIYSDAPERKYNPVLLKRNEDKVDPVTSFGIGILNGAYHLGLGLLGIGTNAPAAAHFGDKVPKDQWANVFPALPNNNAFKDILVPLAVTPLEITKALSEDPSNPELWGEAAVMVFAYSRMSGTKSARVNDIALGLNNLDGTGGSLRKFANKSFSIDQSEWGNGFFKLNSETLFIENFKNVATFVIDNGGKIKFDLSKFDWEKARSQIGKDPYTPAGSMTVAELEHIMGNKKILDGTDFYDNGKKVNKQDVINKFNQAKNK